MDDDTKLRREIHAAAAMHAIIVRLDELPLGDQPNDVAVRAQMFRDSAKVAIEAADAVIAELGPIA